MYANNNNDVIQSPAPADVVLLWYQVPCDAFRDYIPVGNKHHERCLGSGYILPHICINV